MWYFPVLLCMCVGDIIAPILLKKAADLPSRTRRLLGQYVWTLLFSLLTWLIDGRYQFSIVILALGLVSAVGAYAQWRALSISVSKTAAYAILDDIIGILLSQFFLAEGRYLSQGVGIGALLCLLGVCCLTQDRTRSTQESSSRSILWWVLLFSVIWGLSPFLRRLMALEGLSNAGFLFSWYAGTLGGSLLLFFVGGEGERGKALPVSEKRGLVILALVIWLAGLANYWSFQYAPVIVLQPLFQLSGTLLPVCVGLFWFKEHREINRWGWCGIILGIAGAVVIASSYR